MRPRGIRRKGLAAGDDAQVLFALPARFDQQTPVGRRAAHEGDALFVNQALQARTIYHVGARGDRNLPAQRQRQEDLVKCGIKRQGRDRQQMIIFAEAGAAAHGKKQVDRAAVHNLHAFWRASRA